MSNYKTNYVYSNNEQGKFYQKCKSIDHDPKDFKLSQIGDIVKTHRFF